MFSVKRVEENPLLSPHLDHPWEAAAAFNWCPVMHAGTMHAVYRAMAQPELMDDKHLQLSVVGHALSKDGFHWSDRKPFIQPEYDWEKYGCEDPRVTKFGQNYYIFYTALGSYPFRPDTIRIALAKTRDFKKITEKHLVTPFNAKAMALFPEKINGKMAALLTVHTDLPPAHICYAEFENEEDIWSEAYWKNWHDNLDAHRLEVRRRPADQVELGAPPILTDAGWLVVYSHIQNYFAGKPIFGVEILLLDRNNPRLIIGRTKWPIMTPEAQYEKTGVVPNIVFPSGAMLDGNRLVIYYGGADTHCCAASVDLGNLLAAMKEGSFQSHITRFTGNPIISPRSGVKWEEGGTFNPAALEINGKIHLLYRAASDDYVSTIGYASTTDGFSIDDRPTEPVYRPRDIFESRGCEDPRVVMLGSVIYMFYTAYDGITPRVACTSITKDDFIARRWNWTKSFVVTPPFIPDKDAAIFPERIKDKYLFIHRIENFICGQYINSMDFSKEKIIECIEILGPRRGLWDEEKVGLATPPIKTDKGWLLLYHGVSEHTIYRMGAALLNKDNPTEVLARTAMPLLEPSEEYERVGKVPNVVFPCGAVLRGDAIFIYYGAADTTIGVATVSLNAILKSLI
ncbi:MAG: hypothetical protein HYV68_01115 [Candidatus Taylorbacteria bacterium]|nr:hypothetical protein [Candidatus Taylorbacteria bacterium]